MSEGAPLPVGPDQNVPERQVKRVVADLWSHSEALVRQELALLKAEYELRLQTAKAALLRGAMSAALFYAAYLTILAALVLLLAQWTRPWIAALVVGVVAAAGALAFMLLSKRALDATVHPAVTNHHATDESDTTASFESERRQPTQF